jgi:RNA polymerase sigma-70 factor (ECF subfamily)
MAVGRLRVKDDTPLCDPDVRLMLRVRDGDPAAFRELADRYWARVYHQLYLMVGRHEEAEDLTQEVFLRLYRHRQDYRPEAKFATWLFHIVRNLGRNAIRDRRRRPTFPIRSTAPELDDGLDAALSDQRTETPWKPLERRELRELVRLALRRLGRRQRRALELQQFEDHSYSEIADRLALSPQATKSLLYRARNQLREELAPYVLPE